MKLFRKNKKNAEKINGLLNDIDIGIRIITVVYLFFLFISYQLRIDYVPCIKFQNNKIRRFA